MPPEIAKPAPVTVASLTTTGAVPVDVKVTGCGVAEVLTCTLPNATLVALMLSAGSVAFNCRVKVLDRLPALAVNVTACAVATEDAVAVNSALVELAGTVTALGTVTAELLLDRFTVKPPLGAAVVSVRVHASEPDPVMTLLLQYIVLSAEVPASAVPVPLKMITGVDVAEELLAMVNCPVAVPAVAGLNWRFKV